MILWLDAQLAPALATWISEQFGVEVHAVREVGLRDALDIEIFLAARAAGAVVLTKGRDFVVLVGRMGPPPQVVWLRCGNTSNLYLRGLFERAFPPALALLNSGEALVEITERW